jgi:colicin import membrane protein
MAARLSISEKEAFWRRITKCWSPPVGLDCAHDLVVLFRVIFNPDGTVKQGPEVIGGKPGSSGSVFAESTRRAILQCQSYTMLHKETYAEWQDMEIQFSPSDMFKQ